MLSLCTLIFTAPLYHREPITELYVLQSPAEMTDMKLWNLDRVDALIPEIRRVIDEAEFEVIDEVEEE